MNEHINHFLKLRTLKALYHSIYQRPNSSVLQGKIDKHVSVYG